MTKDLQKNEVEVTVSVDIRDGNGAKLSVMRKSVEMGVHRHSHVGSVLAETITAIEQGDEEAFCRIMVASMGSGRRILADVQHDDEVSTRVLKRFATIMEEAEGMNFGTEDEDDDEDEEGDNGFKRKLWV